MPSTLTDYRSTVGRLLPTFGSLPIEEATAFADRGVASWSPRGPSSYSDNLGEFMDASATAAAAPVGFACPAFRP